MYVCIMLGIVKSLITQKGHSQHCNVPVQTVFVQNGGIKQT